MKQEDNKRLKDLVESYLTAIDDYSVAMDLDILTESTTKTNYTTIVSRIISSDNFDVYQLAVYIEAIAALEHPDLIDTVDWAIRQTNDRDAINILSGVQMLYRPEELSDAVDLCLTEKDSGLSQDYYDRLNSATKPDNLIAIIELFLSSNCYSIHGLTRYLQDIIYAEDFTHYNKKGLLESINHAIIGADDEDSIRQLKQMSFELYPEDNLTTH